jgi:hypothetical protein
MTSPQERPDESGADLLAKLFDLRTFTGALFLIFGVIVTVVGLNASDGSSWVPCSSSGCSCARQSCCRGT